MRHYLRVEAVNLGNYVYDTNDIRTVRGGGLLLLAAIESLTKENALGLEPITTGASTGLFEIKEGPTGPRDPKQVRKDAIAHLRKGPDTTRNSLEDAWRHATFVVDVLPASGDSSEAFLKDREQLLALNRWRQMSSPSVAVPSPAETDLPCKLDGVRPAVKADKQGDEKEFMASRSTYVRRTFGGKDRRDGRSNKAAFYESVLGQSIQDDDGAQTEFTHDLELLTADASRGPLHLKMAVFYADGNQFGRVQAEYVRSAPDARSAQRDFDDKLKTYRRKYLEELVDFAKAPPLRDRDNRLRLETLLWGGDEFMFIVPAWLGWRALAMFFEKAAAWTIPTPGAPTHLKHGAGLVFCHRKAPIQRIRRLAHDLADLAKKHHNRNLVAYQVLESFDYVGRDLETYRQERWPRERELLLDGTRMFDVAKHVRQLQDSMPRRKVHEIVRELQAGRSESRTASELLESGGHWKADWEGFRQAVGGTDAAWIHLAELWDFITPESSPGKTAAEKSQ